ncbi:glycosyltransferase family 4 protein [Paraflavisolibacter sp. H34]|uniref:glycosyltransferase family 4 protein n=1 Tax=Huijunlia imazamoxiresistens TaxID=3127457 RepID=UPI003017BE9F
MKATTKIKVLQGIRQGKIGGGESYLLGLVEQLDKSRFEPVVLSFTDGPMVDRLRGWGVATHVIYTEKPFDFSVWGKVSRLLREEGIDLVHAHGTRAMSNMFRPAVRSGLPLVYTCHGWSFHRGQHPLVRKVRMVSEKYLTQKASVNICGARASRDEARECFGRFDAEIIYNSIDYQRFNPEGQYKDVRRELGIPADALVVASIARFTHQKQPLLLVEAFARMAQKVPHALLLMVGDGELKEETLQLIEKLGIADRVVQQSFRTDVPDVLAAADIFVLPSLWEVFPIALLEAMAMGKAVIATGVDGTAEMVQHGQNGLLLDLNHLLPDLEAALLELGTNEARRKQLGANALASVANKYRIDELARKNEQIYQRLAAR